MSCEIITLYRDLNDHMRFWSTKISPIQMMLPKHVVRELARDDHKDYKGGFLVIQNGFKRAALGLYG